MQKETMFTRLLFVLLLACSLQQAAAQTPDTRCFELRIYYCHPGRLDALVQRFTNHTTRLFEKHHMQNIGYWLPVDNRENTLYYVLAYPSRQARDSSWNAFNADSAWIGVRTRSEEGGKIVAKVTSVFMEAADFSPAITPSHGNKDRLFELRMYNCRPGDLAALSDRFRNHTATLLAQAGMENIACWRSTPAGSSEHALVCMVAHANEKAARKSWKKFDHNPEWIRVRDASEKNGPLTERITSVLLRPLPFSLIR